MYFSSTGNTKYISEVICDKFRNNGHAVELYSLEENINIHPNSYDFVVIGFPKFFEYTPIFLLDIIKNKIPSTINNVPVMLFCTEGGPTKTGFYDVAKILEEKNHTVVTTKSFRMPNNYYLKNYYKPKSSEDDMNRINNSKAQAEAMVQSFLNKNYNIEPLSKFMAGLFRNLAYKNNKKIPLFTKKFSVNSSCTSCKLCEAKCPVKNISLVNGKPQFNENCVLCLRCINSCPNNAILYDKKILHQYKFPTDLLTK